MGRQERTDVLNRTTNEQSLMRPRPSDGWLNISNNFSQELLASGEGGGGGVGGWVWERSTIFSRLTKRFPDIS